MQVVIKLLLLKSLASSWGLKPIFLFIVSLNKTRMFPLSSFLNTSLLSIFIKIFCVWQNLSSLSLSTICSQSEWSDESLTHGENTALLLKTHVAVLATFFMCIGCYHIDVYFTPFVVIYMSIRITFPINTKTPNLILFPRNAFCRFIFLK